MRERAATPTAKAAMAQRRLGQCSGVPVTTCAHSGAGVLLVTVTTKSAMLGTIQKRFVPSARLDSSAMPSNAAKMRNEIRAASLPIRSQTAPPRIPPVTPMPARRSRDSCRRSTLAT